MHKVNNIRIINYFFGGLFFLNLIDNKNEINRINIF